MEKNPEIEAVQSALETIVNGQGGDVVKALQVLDAAAQCVEDNTLRHYLHKRSYVKALEWLVAGAAQPGKCGGR